MKRASNAGGPSATTLVVRGCTVWMLIAVAETLHGVGRTIFLTPALGEHLARQVGVFIGSIMILAIAWLFVGWIGGTTPRRLLAVGLLWLVLMLAFEVGLGRAVGLSWERIASDYDPTQGGLMLVGMGVLFLAPLLAAKARRARPRQEY